MIKLFDKRRVGFALLLIVLFVFNFGNIISYADDSKSDTEVSTFFIDFANKAFTNIDTLHVTNQEGEDVTNYFIDKTENLFKQNDYKAIQDLIVNEKLVPSIENSVVSKTNNDIMRSSRTQYCYEIITNSYNLQGQVQSWQVLLSGTITYNPNTGQIYSSSSPAFSLYSTSGINPQLTAELKSVSAGYQILTSKVRYYATYTLEVYVGGYIEGMDLPILKMISFGSNLAQFYAYPDY